MAEGARYRYPGPQEFEDTPADSRRFFGRTQEISTVAERIIASRLLVVYAGSGLGKSSLLKAGVFPKLRAENLLPVRVRMNKPGCGVLELLREACTEAARDTGQEFAIDYTPGKGQTAWEFFRTVMFWRGERLVPPVLVFDQFEEIFTLADAAWRKEFGREIGPLASANAPAAVRERLRSGELGLSDQAPKVKLVFCLREEYYGSLQELSPQFPGLFQDRFRLRPLDARQAELAIVEPARLESGESSADSFLTPTFEYESAAIGSILDFLRDKSQYIEPVPLQLLCQYVEQTIVQGKQKAGAPSPIMIAAGDLGGKDAMNKVIGRFYKDSIDGLPASERRHARELCDTGLLAAAGNRLLLEKNQITKDYKVSDATLRYLTDERRILRQEPRLESTFYEISHDTIARSIFESRKWRLPKQWRLAVAASSILMLALLAIASWALVERNKEVEERHSADQATQAARNSEQREKTSEASANKSAHEAHISEEKAKQSLREAEGMVAFLMGEDFLGKIRPMGRLNVFEDLQKAVPCKAGASGPVSEVGLRNLGLACLNEGDLDYAQLRLREANKRYDTARRYFSELAQQKGNGNDESLAEVLFNMGRVAEDQLDLDRSLDLTRQALRMQERLVAGGRSDEKLLRDRANSYVYVGEIQGKQGHLREALENIDKAIALSQGKDGTEWLYIRQDGLIEESEIFAQQGDSTRSEKSAQEAYECAKEAVGKSPFAPEAKYRLGAALSRLPASAQELLSKYQEVFDDVASAAAWDPENKAWARDLAVTHILLGEGLVAGKQWDKAAEHYKTAIPMVEKLLKLDPANRQLKADLLVRLHESLGLAYMQQDPATLGKFQAAMKPGAATSEPDAGSGKVAPLQAESKVGPGRSDEALDEFHTAQRLLKPLEEYARGDVELRRRDGRLANEEFLLFYDHVAPLRRSDKDEAGALTAYRQALGAVERAVMLQPEDVILRYNLALAQQAIGDSLRDANQFAQAEEQYLAAEKAWRDTIQLKQDVASYQNRLFLFFYDHVAVLRKKQKDEAAIRKAYEDSLGPVVKAAELDPKQPVYQNNLALAQQQIGDSYRNINQFAEAEEHYTATEKAWRNAIQLKGDSADYHNRLFLLFYDHVAVLRKKQKDNAAALKAYEDSLGPVVKAAELDPKQPVYQNNLALAQEQIGDSFRDSGQFAQAEEHYTAGEKAWRNAIQLKESAEYENRLFLLFYDHVAVLRKKQKDNAAALKAYEDSLGPVVKAAELDPKQPVYQNNLALAQEQIGDSFRDSGQFAQAKEHYTAAEKVWRNAIQLKESAPYWNNLFLLFYDHVSELCKKQKDDAGLLKIYQDALEAERRAAALAPKEHVYRSNIAKALWKIGQQQSDKGHALETLRLAVETLREGMTLLPEGESGSHQGEDDQTGLYVILHDDIAPILHERKDSSGELSALSEALTAAQAAALKKDNAGYQSNLGWAQLGLGDFQRQHGADKTRALESYVQAEQAFREAARLKPNEAEYWKFVADACKREGLIQEDKGESLAAKTSYHDALQAIEQAGKLNPDASMRQFREDVLKKLGPDK